MEPGWQKKPDGELLIKWQQNPGSPDADQIVTELLQRYRLKVYRWCGRFINDPDRALDLTQDILSQIQGPIRIVDKPTAPAVNLQAVTLKEFCHYLVCIRTAWVLLPFDQQFPIRFFLPSGFHYSLTGLEW